MGLGEGPRGVEGLRFGRIAYKHGYVTLEQLHEALCEQIDDDVGNRPHRRMGAILVEKKWMTPEQVDAVLGEMASQAKAEG